MLTPTPVQTFALQSSLDAPAGTVFSWHASPGAFERLAPPWMNVRLVHFEGIHDGDRAVLRLGAGPFYLTWVAEHRDYVEGRQFRDVQVEGPFRRWEHTHRMEPTGPEACLLEDLIRYDLPLGILGNTVGGSLAQQQLERQFAYRHRITKQDLAAHRRYHPGRPLKIAVSGASGLIGSSLVPFLTAGGHEVLRIVRSRPTKPDREIFWNQQEGRIDAGKLEGLDAVVHLAGESIYALRWSKQKKQRILESRAEGARLLSETLARLDYPPEVLISASGISCYGNRGDEILTERSEVGQSGFLTQVTHAWEAATAPAERAGIRVVKLRIGVMLTPKGGALALLLPVFRLGLGGRLNRENHYLSWIGLDDVLQAIYHTLAKKDLSGPVNLTAPEPVTVNTFSQTLGRVLSRPVPLRVPAAWLRSALGEIAEETALASARVLPERLLDTGYRFLYPDLEAALRHQLGKTLKT